MQYAKLHNNTYYATHYFSITKIFFFFAGFEPGSPGAKSYAQAAEVRHLETVTPAFVGRRYVAVRPGYRRHMLECPNMHTCRTGVSLILSSPAFSWEDGRT